MKANELRQKNVAELDKELLDLRKAQFSLSMQVATQQLSNTSQLGKVRKDIARIKTIQREKAAAKLTRRPRPAKKCAAPFRAASSATK